PRSGLADLSNHVRDTRWAWLERSPADRRSAVGEGVFPTPQYATVPMREAALIPDRELSAGRVDCLHRSRQLLALVPSIQEKRETRSPSGRHSPCGNGPPDENGAWATDDRMGFYRAFASSSRSRRRS